MTFCPDFQNDFQWLIIKIYLIRLFKEKLKTKNRTVEDNKYIKNRLLQLLHVSLPFLVTNVKRKLRVESIIPKIFTESLLYAFHCPGLYKSEHIYLGRSLLKWNLDFHCLIKINNQFRGQRQSFSSAKF